jgi:tetratricopeptide (TPR) repeat protein
LRRCGARSADGEAALALAEALAERLRREIRDRGSHAVIHGPGFAEALALYGDLARRPPGGDPGLAVRILQGAARLHIEAMDAEGPGGAFAPGSHFRRAEEALARAEALDPPPGRLRDARGLKTLAETWYLRARANKRAHAGDRDHKDAVGWYEKARTAEPGHLEAHWDLALLYADLLRSAEYVKKADELFAHACILREARGLAPLAPEELRIVAQVHEWAERGTGVPEGAALGGGE